MIKRPWNKLSPLVAAVLLTPAVSSLCAQYMNPDFVHETEAGFVGQPDLDGDGVSDLILVDRLSGNVRPALLEPGGPDWMEPVAGGIGNVSGVAYGRIEDPSIDSLVLTSPEANRLNVFSYTGDTLNRSPRSVFNEIWGLSEIAAIEEGSAGSATTPELIGFSGLFDPSSPGLRDFIRWNGTELVSYFPGFPNPAYSERDYQIVFAESGLPI